MSRFVHLHNHSEFSLLDAIARIDDIVARLVELGYDSYALTDHGVMYGALEFYTRMRDAGLRPIIGCEMYIAQRRLTDKGAEIDRKSAHLVLLAANRTGYVNLMRLTSIAHQQGYYYKPRVDFEAVAEFSEGLVALTACPKGVVAGPFHRDGEEAGKRELERWLKIFGPERLFLEIQHHGLEMEERFRQWAQQIGQSVGVRLVATNDCHYVHKEDARAHDIALCLRDKKLLTDTDRQRYSGPEYYIRSAEEMAELFADFPEALENTADVVEMCDLELDLDQVHFPRFGIPGQAVAEEKRPALAAPTPADDSEQLELDAYLRRLTCEGAEKRYGQLTPELRDRIDYELEVITAKGFTPYFLICAEICGYARGQGIPVGPGRGSAAGSVVTYCLEITDLDPIKYGLYFERFLNPERVELPDFDIDFCFRRRDEVIEHVKQKYGADRVALIITFSRLKARAVLKAVGRAKGMEFQRVDRVTKEIRGLNPTISEAVAASSALQAMIAGDPDIAELIDDSRRLEGVASHHSVHAAGLVIAPGELWHFVPVQPHKDTDLLVTQYAMEMVSKTGLVKFDFLGLRNLTMIQDTGEYVRRLEGVDFDPRRIPDDDQATFAMLQHGDAYGVFQFEAPQVKRMLTEGRPQSVSDLAVINAANRPGPLTSGNTERYLANRRARVSGTSPYPSIAEILEPTGGVLLFQEQVLEIARKLGGFSMGEADILRKAMGKKIHEAMHAQEEKFMAGAGSRGIPAAEARAIWEMMVQFAGYGFNKAHSVCYAWVAYQTAYLKCHYPHYYMCALLNNYVGDSAKLGEILAQCRLMRIAVLPPSVNDGAFEFTPQADGKIIFGLSGIKGLGRAAVDAMVAERSRNGPYASLASFLARTRGSGVNRKVLQSLAMAGAFDCLQPDRAELIRNLDRVEDFMRGPERQSGLFVGHEQEPSTAGALPTRAVSPEDVALLEKAAIGVFLTHHPFADHPMFADKRFYQLAELQQSVQYDASRWQDTPLPSNGLAGFLSDVKVRVAKTSRQTYAKARLEDSERSVSLIIWPKAYEAARNWVLENGPVIVWGRVQIPETADTPDDAWNGVEVVADRVMEYAGPPAGAGPRRPAPAGPKAVRPAPTTPQKGPEAHHRGQAIKWDIDLTKTTRDDLARLQLMLEQAEGDTEIRMALRGVGGQLKRVRVSQRFFVSLDTARRLAREFPFITPR